MLTLRKKVILFFITAIFSYSVLGFFGVSVAHASILDFIRAFVTINPLAVEVTAPARADLNRIFKVEADVINKGEVKIENVTGEIFLPPGLTISGKEVKKIGIVSGGKEKKISWSVKGESLGAYVITVFISGAVNGDSVSADGSTVVIIVEKAPLPVRLPGIFQSFFDLLGKWFGG